MQGFVRNSALAVCALALNVPVNATDGVFLPAAPRGSGGEDSIETATGTRCRQSINSNGAYLDFGAAGKAAKPLDDVGRNVFTDERDQEALLYLRFTVPLGAKPKRIDCSRLYEMEIQRLQRELEMLRFAAE